MVIMTAKYLNILIYLFVVLRNSKTGEDPCTGSWKNLMVTKVDPLLDLGSLCVCLALQLLISH